MRESLSLPAVGLMLFAFGCEKETRPEAQTVIARSIEAHGGDRFERATVSFDFRGGRYTIERRNGLFRYERRIETDDRVVTHILTNDSLFMEINGEWAPWPDDRRKRSAESTLNSVVYFSSLPFRLADPAVRPYALDTATVRNQPYYVVKIAFDQEGGGRDWEDRFAYWFHRDTYRMDFLAYRFFTGEGGTRFREAVNSRTVEGIRFQDYLNYTRAEIGDITEYPVYLESGDLNLISRIEIENAEVRLNR